MRATEDFVGPRTAKAAARKGGEHTDSSSFFTINPATGETIETFPFFTSEETEAATARPIFTDNNNYENNSYRSRYPQQFPS